MPKLYIEKQYSHMGGKELVQVNKPFLYNEIQQAITQAKIPEKSKISEEKTKKGELLWSGRDFNGPIEDTFRRLNWNKERLSLDGGQYIEGDFFKERVGLEVLLLQEHDRSMRRGCSF